MNNHKEFVEDIKRARAAYGISTAFMGEILGFGPNQLRLYESGEVPKKSSALALILICTPFGMKSYLDKSPKMIRQRKEFPKLYATVQQMCNDIEQSIQKIKDNLNKNYFK